MSGAALFNLAQTALTSDAGNISSSSSRDGLARAASMPLQRQRNGAAKPPLEWRRFLTVEDCVETNQWIFVNPTPSSRRGHGDNVASMAWKPHAIEQTQLRRGAPEIRFPHSSKPVGHRFLEQSAP